jgi:drug/metabolite transporter (DMT)-like permease
MTTDTAKTATTTPPTYCAQTFAAAGSLGIVGHVVHEGFTELRDAAPGAVVVLVVAVAATAALTALWYRLGTRTRRAVAAVLGVLWVLAASEHVVALLGGDGTALDWTGLLAVAGGVLLIVAAYWDAHRPYEVIR